MLTSAKDAGRPKKGTSKKVVRGDVGSSQEVLPSPARSLQEEPQPPGVLQEEPLPPASREPNGEILTSGEEMGRLKKGSGQAKITGITMMTVTKKAGVSPTEEPASGSGLKIVVSKAVSRVRARPGPTAIPRISRAPANPNVAPLVTEETGNDLSYLPQNIQLGMRFHQVRRNVHFQVGETPDGPELEEVMRGHYNAKISTHQLVQIRQL